MKKRFQNSLKIIVVTLAAVGIFLHLTRPAEAVFDESEAVRYAEFAAANRIEESTLFIGTYLIHIQGLTDEIYERAEQSASDSGQTDRYYKSELAGGNWMDITSAKGLSDIASQGVLVEERQLADLWVTYYVGSDGVVRNARTKGAVSVFDNPNPYDLYAMPELEPLRLQYDNTYRDELSAENKTLKTYYAERLRDLFRQEVRDGVTVECDRQLATLRNLSDRLRATDKKELAEIVQTLMAKVDARRRAQVFYLLSQTENCYLNTLQQQLNGAGYSAGNYSDNQFVQNGDLMDALGDCMDNCQSSYIEQSGNMLEMLDSVLGEAEYNTSMRIISQTGGGAETERMIWKLRYIYSIKDDVVTDSEKEIELLDGELLQAAENKYKKGLSAGAGSKYKAVLSNNSPLSVRQRVLDEQKEELEVLRSELQYLIKAKTKRQAARAALDFTYQRLDAAEGFSGSVRNDDFAASAKDTITAHILWLQELAQTIIDGDESLKAELTKLQEKKADLLLAKAEALDNNDLAGAGKYDAQIAAVDADIQKEINKMLSKLNDPSSSEKDKAKALAGLGSKTMEGNILDLKNRALQNIAEGNLDNIGNLADALAGLGASGALGEIADALSASGNQSADGLKNAKNALAKAQSDSKDSPLQGINGNLGTGTGSGSGSGSGAGSGAGSGSGIGSGAGDGSGSGSGSGTGSGDGTGAGDGTGSGDGTGAGDGTGSGDGTGAGDGSGSGDGTGDGSGTGSGSGADGAGAGMSDAAARLGAMSQDELMAYLDELLSGILGGPFDSLNADGQVVAASAMSRLGKEGIRSAAQLSVTLISRCADSRNKYVYVQYPAGGDTRYIPFRNIGSATKYRYVYSDSKKEVTMTGNVNTYCFVVGSQRMQRGASGKSEDMAEKVVFATLPYLSEKDSLNYFDCGAEYFENTEYAACLTKAMSGQAEEIVKAAKGGEE